MKRLQTFLAIFFITLILCTQMWAQNSMGIPYQGVARNATGEMLANKRIALRMTIRNGTGAGAVVYQETHSCTTNALGLFNVNIGYGSAESNNRFDDINWGDVTKFIQVGLDVNGGNAFSDMGTMQFMAVPYALYAERTRYGGGKGDNGKDGRDGKDGERGATGPQGPAGMKGETGAMGPQGMKGDAGKDGKDGKDGDRGATGPQGMKGDAGKDGKDGKDGDRGATGPQA